MSEEKVTFGNLWSRSWAALRGNYWKCIAVFAILGIIQGVLNRYVTIGGVLLLGPLTIGQYLFFLQLARGNSPKIESIFQPFRSYGHYLWVYLRPGIFTFLWSLLFIIPGIIAAFRYAMTNYVALDEPELSAKEAMEKSCRLMKGHKLQLFGYGVVISLLLFVAGLGTLGIALFWLLPWAGAFFPNFYLALRAEAEPGPEPVSENNAGEPADAEVR